MSVLAARDDRRHSRLHALEVLAAAPQVTAVAGPIAGPLLEAAALGAGALQGDVEGHAVEKGREPIGARHTHSQRLQKAMVGLAEPPLTGVQLVGARLAMMEGKASVRPRPDAPILSHFYVSSTK
ncbi:hypothetical protein D3876_18380 [Sphingomonas cavernae]|uniref:Uncharacterized protein n=1 Tax=Sphingomonas cavernae TaxID=2320861 RepID=A0A418W750_9SPHN|nr:hypothetical protein D3876_18380 [Sphingomonas cavernae]